MKREPGYYWVRYGGEWVIANYHQSNYERGNPWVFSYVFMGDEIHEHMLDEINETRIPSPDEVIPIGEAFNLLYVLATCAKSKSEFIDHCLSQYDITFTAKNK